jgi:MHS family proline/betaine transporter-like MFS transporter
MLLVTPVSLLFSWWADIIGRRGLLLASAVLGVAGSVPFFMLMQQGAIYWGQAGFVLALSVQFGVQGAMMVEVTPANVRCTVLAIGNNIGWSILGGLTPLAATWLTARTGDSLAPAWLVAAAAAITAVTLVLTADPFRRKTASRIVRT